MTQKSCNFLHPAELPTGSAKAIRLVFRRSGDKRTVVPEAHRMGHGGVTLREEVLELVRLKVVRNCLVTAVLGEGLTLPPFLTHLLALHYLHHRLHRRVIAIDKH